MVATDDPQAVAPAMSISIALHSGLASGLDFRSENAIFSMLDIGKNPLIALSPPKLSGIVGNNSV